MSSKSDLSLCLRVAIAETTEEKLQGLPYQASFFGWCCCFPSPFGGVAFLHLLWVELIFSLSSVGRCYLVSPSLGKTKTKCILKVLATGGGRGGNRSLGESWRQSKREAGFGSQGKVKLDVVALLLGLPPRTSRHERHYTKHWWTLNTEVLHGQIILITCLQKFAQGFVHPCRHIFRMGLKRATKSLQFQLMRTSRTKVVENRQGGEQS